MDDINPRETEHDLRCPRHEGRVRPSQEPISRPAGRYKAEQGDGQPQGRADPRTAFHICQVANPGNAHRLPHHPRRCLYAKGSPTYPLILLRHPQHEALPCIHESHGSRLLPRQASEGRGRDCPRRMQHGRDEDLGKQEGKHRTKGKGGNGILHSPIPRPYHRRGEQDGSRWQGKQGQVAVCVRTPRRDNARQPFAHRLDTD